METPIQAAKVHLHRRSEGHIALSHGMDVCRSTRKSQWRSHAEGGVGQTGLGEEGR
jgi:hypothetical protein